MSYQTYDKNAAGIVFFGTNATDQVFESNANFTIDGTSLLATNLKISNGGNIGSTGASDAIAIASDGDVTFGYDISIAGNLTVNGTTTTVNSTTVTIDDPIFTLGGDTAPASDDNKDRGIEFNWHNGSAAKVGFFGFDDSTGKFTFIPDATNSSEVFSGTAGTIVADLEGDVTGNVTGNASTATALASSLTLNLTDELTGSVSFDGDEGSVNLSASLTAAAITGLTDLGAAPDATNDFIMIYDASATALKKVNRTNFVSGLGAMSSFTVSDGSTSVTTSDGETLTFADGTGAEFVVSDVAGEPTVTVNSVDSEIDHDALSNFVPNEHINHTSVLLDAGAGLTGGGDISASRQFNVGAGDGITVNANEVEVTVDGSTIELSASDGTGAVRVKDGGITFAKLSGAAYLTSVETFSDSDTQLMTAKAINDRIESFGYSTTTGTVTSVGGTGSVNGITLTGTVTTAGNLTLGGTLGNIANSQLTNSAITIAGVSTSLGGSITADTIAGAISAGTITNGQLANSAITIAGVSTSLGGSITANTIAAAIGAGQIANSQLANDSVSFGGVSLDLGQSDATPAFNLTDATNYKAASLVRTTAAVSTTSTLSNDVNLCSGGAGGITVTLPSVADGKMISIKKVDSAAGTVTIQRGGTANIDGATTKALYYQYESMTLVSDGTDWFIV